MNFVRLQYFVTVAEELSFTRAAARLHVSQPPLTLQIQRLEEEVGHLLIRRSTRRLELTAEGRVLLEEARLLLARYGRLKTTVHEASIGRLETLNIGCVPSAVIGIAPALLQQVKSRFPQISVRVLETPIEEQEPMLRTGDLDVGIFRSHRPHAKWPSFEMAAEDFVLAVPTSHALAAKDAVEWSDLEGERIVAAERSRAIIESDSVVAACATHGFSPQIVAESVEGYNLIALVAGGVGVGIVPRTVTSMSIAGMTYRPLTPPTRAVPLRVVVRPDVWGRASVQALVREVITEL